MAIQWDLKALRARTKDAGKRVLHEAGSPNQAELDLYGRFLTGAFPDERPPPNMHVVVLGMTPGLRRLAHGLRCEVTCVDNNTTAIEFYRDWTPPERSAHERILEVDWMDMAAHIDRPVDAILGDGIFGNVLSIPRHRELLGVIKGVVAESGIVIFRKILIPRSLSLEENEAERLLHDFRADRLSEAEFGFAMRLWGSSRTAYEPETCLLDNKRVFERYQAWHDDGVLTADEHAIVERYYFGGLNLIPPIDLWETLLTESGFEFERGLLTGRAWYDYYPIYRCRVTSDPAAGSNREPAA